MLDNSEEIGEWFSRFISLEEKGRRSVWIMGGRLFLYIPFIFKGLGFGINVGMGLAVPCFYISDLSNCEKDFPVIPRCPQHAAYLMKVNKGDILDLVVEYCNENDGLLLEAIPECDFS